MNLASFSRAHITRGFLIVGLALFAILVWKIGPALIGAVIWRVGWALPLVVMPQILITLFETLGWWFAFADPHPPIAYRKLFEFTVGAKAIQMITPSIAQAEEYYRALKKRGVDVVFIRYPREGHGITEPNHQIDLVHRQLEWFDSHLGITRPKPGIAASETKN